MTQPAASRPPVERTLDTILSWLAFAATPAVLAVGFWLGYGLVGDPNEPGAPRGWEGAWRILVLWAAVEVVPVIGIVLGLRAARRREAAGRAAVVANALVFLVLTALTLVGGLVDVL